MKTIEKNRGWYTKDTATTGTVTAATQCLPVPGLRIVEWCLCVSPGPCTDQIYKALFHSQSALLQSSSSITSRTPPVLQGTPETGCFVSEQTWVLGYPPRCCALGCSSSFNDFKLSRSCPGKGDATSCNMEGPWINDLRTDFQSLIARGDNAFEDHSKRFGNPPHQHHKAGIGPTWLSLYFPWHSPSGRLRPAALPLCRGGDSVVW